MTEVKVGCTDIKIHLFSEIKIYICFVQLSCRILPGYSETLI